MRLDARQLIEAAAAAGSTDKDTFNQVANVDGVDLSYPEGGLCPHNSAENHLQPVPGAALVQVVDGAYVSAVEFSCWRLLDE